MTRTDRTAKGRVVAASVIVVLAGLAGCSGGSSGGSTGNGSSGSSGGSTSGSSSGGSSSSGSSSGGNCSQSGQGTTSGYASGTFTAPGFTATLTCVGINLHAGNSTFTNGYELLFSTGEDTGTDDAGTATVTTQMQFEFAAAPTVRTYSNTDSDFCGGATVSFKGSSEFDSYGGTAAACGGGATGTITLDFTDATAPHGTLTSTLTDNDHPKTVSGMLQLTF